MKLATINESTAILTAHRSNRSEDQNRKALGSLIGDIKSRGYRFTIKKGSWHGKKETALVVYGISKEIATELAHKHKQQAIIFNSKLLRIG